MYQPSVERVAIIPTRAPVAEPSAPTSEMMRLLVDATIRRLEAMKTVLPKISGGPVVPMSHPLDTTSKTENDVLKGWVAQQLGGTCIGATTTQNGLGANVARPPRSLDLTHEVLSPQARDALIALSLNDRSLNLDSDDILGILNTGPIPEIYLPPSATETFPWDSLLSPEAQSGLAAIAHGQRSAPDADELLDILNGGGGVTVPTTADDSWIARLLSVEARDGLAALAQYTGQIEDSDALLNILNAGNGVVERAGQTWEEEILTPNMRNALSVLEARWDNGGYPTSDDVLAALNVDYNMQEFYGESEDATSDLEEEDPLSVGRAYVDHADLFAATIEDEGLAWQADLFSAAHTSTDLVKRHQSQGLESDVGLVVQQLSKNAIYGLTETPFSALSQFIHQVDASSATSNSEDIEFDHEDYSPSRKQLFEPRREVFRLMPLAKRFPTIFGPLAEWVWDEDYEDDQSYRGCQSQ
ncbi:hypothetical protein C8F04DRAFT_1183136 [Mycena alexandri]|uniref:Uncharacterized protein n=1 Tax=Mycena alexandri TaxID=1745969 RepID=A0AAD6X4I3_9AGAR|nr:hypothetical protein C8F04DRAFT_1183136 [Mycena alexandri]